MQDASTAFLWEVSPPFPQAELKNFMDWKPIQATEHVQAALSEHWVCCVGYNNLWSLPGYAGELCVSVRLHITTVLWHCPLSSKHPIYWPMDWKVGGDDSMWSPHLSQWTPSSGLVSRTQFAVSSVVTLHEVQLLLVLSVTAQIFSEVEHHFNISRVVNDADTESNLDTLIAVLGKEKTFHTNAV